jgi:hypothetical protein
VKRTSIFVGLLWLFDSLVCEVTQGAIDCPVMPNPSQINRDVRSDIQSRVGSLGKLKAGEVEIKTEVVAKNLFEKYPNIERVLTAQMMAATYCSMIRESTSLSEREKQDRWEKFYDRVFSFVSPESSRSTPSKSPSRKESVKKPDKTSEKKPDKPSQAVTPGESMTQGKSPPQPEDQRVTPMPEQQASGPSPTTPKSVTPPPVNDARIAKSAPPSVIPQDPVKAVQAVEGMRTGIREVIQKKETITFLLTHPKDEQEYLVFISTLLSSACRVTPRQCWFTQEGNPRDLDRPPVQRSGKRGIIVHGPDADPLAHALGSWFVTYSTSRLPPEMNGYKIEGTAHLIWIDIGPGSPWKQ